MRADEFLDEGNLVRPDFGAPILSSWPATATALWPKAMPVAGTAHSIKSGLKNAWRNG